MPGLSIIGTKADSVQSGLDYISGPKASVYGAPRGHDPFNKRIHIDPCQGVVLVRFNDQSPVLRNGPPNALT